jgi:hypothetical protein
MFGDLRCSQKRMGRIYRGGREARMFLGGGGFTMKGMKVFLGEGKIHCSFKIL